MTDLKRGEQHGQGSDASITGSDGSAANEKNKGSQFGAAEKATRGTNRNFDESGESQNQGHGHPREERSNDG